MKAKNADQLFRHVCNLQKLANVSTYHEAFLIYKKLHRIEARMNRIFTDECNGYLELNEDQEEKRNQRVIKQLNDMLPGLKTIFLNGDPRGYALKISSEEARELRDKGINIYTDWGGYGILCPEF
jgi:hypothetical protein